MAEKEEVAKVAASCQTCGSVYAAREWPEGEIQPIGTERCSCGASRFTVIEGVDDFDLEFPPEQE